MGSSIRRWLIACGLAGASQFAVAAAPAPSIAELARTHGYAYVSEPQHIGATTNQLLTSDAAIELKVQSVATSQRYTFEQRKNSATTAFGAWLPAGEYRITSWGSHDWGDYPSFQVEAGRVTDLGSLVPMSVGGDQFVMLPVHRADQPASVSEAVSEFRSVLAAEAPLTWDPQVVPKSMTMSSSMLPIGIIGALILEYDRHHNAPPYHEQLRSAASIDQFARLARASTPPLCATPATDERGDLYFCAGFGQIRVRSATGEWSSLDTGSWEPITSVAWTREAIYAGSNDGVVRASSDGGKTWKSVFAFEANDPVISIVDAGGRWLVVTQHNGHWFELARKMIPDEISVYSSADGRFSDFSISKKISLSGTATRSDWQGPTPAFHGGYYYLGTGTGMLRMDVAHNEWTSVTVPTEITGFAVSPTGSTMTAYLAKGMFSNVVTSTDGGATWSKVPAPSLIISDVYFDEHGGRADRLHPGAVSATLERYSYDAASRRWVLAQELPAECARLLHTPDRRESFCVTRGGSILRDDQGTWRVEFSVD